jgi:Carboxypeptidase regulatory-like domain/TonB dependent receptor-like, beta-barrel
VNWKINTSFLFVLISATVFAQRLDGTLRGTVKDPAGAVISGGTVNAVNQVTGVRESTKTTSTGEYVFPNLLVGMYTVEVESPGFSRFARRDVEVLPNQVITADASLTVGAENTIIEVVGGAETVQTTTSQLSNDFGARAVSDLPSPGLGGGPLNLALLAPNTTTQGAGVLGEGGSIGGARPRLNSFNIDGVDDNRVDVTGHTSEVIPEAVADFNLVTNMFSAELGHSAGGQFNIVTKSGTNAWHGAAWEFNNNRDFNAMDNLEKGSGLTAPRRVDRNRAGADIGGPLIKDKLFIYGAYQFSGIGLSAAAVQQLAPTAAGLAQLNSMAANDTVRSILSQFPTAPVADAPSQTVNGVSIPIGTFQPAAPSYLNQHDFNINGDLNLARHSVRGRFLYDRQRQPNVNPDTPQAQFTGSVAADNRKIIITDAWTVTDHMINDFRVSYSRFVQAFTVPTEFANFPNAKVDVLGLNIGPEGNSPQSYVQNNYQVLNNISIVKGAHTFKFGPEYRRWIAPSNFLPRERGEWDYDDLQTLINDQIPDGFNGALRGAGTGLFNGNQTALYGFVQDDWKVAPRLTLNLGLRYEWTSNPADVKKQTLNAISTLPGVYDFREPATDTNNIMPRVGFALDPTGSGRWAVRGGFGVSFDVTPQNFPLLNLPPQLQTQQDPGLTCGLPNPPTWCASGSGFLGGGGLRQVNVPPATQQEARLATQGIILDQVQPKILTWTLGVQRELMKDTSLEVRYLGTQATQLLVQARSNTMSAFTAGLQPLPTFFSASPVPATIVGGSRLSDFENFNPFIHPEFTEVDANGDLVGGALVTTFPPIGSSTYHAGSIDLNRRFSRGVMLRGNYTYAHNIDDSTNELFSSVVNPRRPFDWQNLRLDRGRSVLDVRHKFALSWLYELPNISTDSGLLKTLAHGWQWNGTFLAQTGQPISVLANADANGNADAAGDRAILNSAGIARLGTSVKYVCAGPGGVTSIMPIPAKASDPSCPGGGSANVAGYVAQNPNARYVQAELGAFPTVGRNTFESPGVNVWNLGLFKNTKLTERATLQLRVDTFNTFNHRNYSLAQPTVFQTGTLIGTVNNSLSTTYANVTSPLFLNDRQFTGGNRQMMLGVKVLW